MKVNPLNEYATGTIPTPAEESSHLREKHSSMKQIRKLLGVLVARLFVFKRKRNVDPCL